jgi:uncharacterized membrane protein
MNKDRAAAVPKAARHGHSWRRLHGGLIAISALYLVLSFFHIGHQSLWTDEVISVRRTDTFTSLWNRVNSQSPAYFNLLGLWADGFGTTEWALRSLSALLGLGAIGLVYLIGLRFFDRRIALLAALLLATSPFFIWYAQEVRYITLLIVASLAMTYSFHRAVSAGGWQWWLLYGLTTALALFTFVTVLFLVLAHGFYLLRGASRRRFLKSWLASQLVIIVLFAAWFVARPGNRVGKLLAQRPTVVSPEQVRSRAKLPVTDLVGAIPYTFFTFSAGFSLGPSLRELHESRSLDMLLHHAPTLIALAALFGSLFVLGLARLRQERRTGLFLLLWLGAPIVGVFMAATLTTYHPYNARYVAMVLPVYLLIVALGIAAIRNSRARFGLIAAVLLVHGLSLYNYYFDSRYGREDARAAARYLEAEAREGIILVVGHPRPLRYYYKGGLPVQTIGARGRNDDLLAGELRELVNRHNRLWLVEIRSWQKDPKQRVKNTLDQLAGRSEHKGFPGVDVYLYNSLVRWSALSHGSRMEGYESGRNERTEP